MIELAGSKQFTVSIERLYPELADLTRLVQSLPDVKTVKEVSEEAAVIVVAPGLSFIKGELETTIQRTATSPPIAATLSIASKGIGTTVKVTASFALTTIESGSEMNWQAQVTELGGLLKLIPGSLLKGAAQKVIEGWLTSLAARLS
jgi:carbon monoxide dehydrogenase subunit G